MNLISFIIGYSVISCFFQMMVPLLNQGSFKLIKAQDITAAVEEGQITEEASRKVVKKTIFLTSCLLISKAITFVCSSILLICGIFKFGIFSWGLLKLIISITITGSLCNWISFGILYWVYPDQMKKDVAEEMKKRESQAV